MPRKRNSLCGLWRQTLSARVDGGQSNPINGLDGDQAMRHVSQPAFTAKGCGVRRWRTGCGTAIRMRSVTLRCLIANQSLGMASTGAALGHGRVGLTCALIAGQLGGSGRPQM